MSNQVIDLQEKDAFDFSEFNPESLAVCAFFTFFLVNDHSKYKSILLNIEDAMTFFGMNKIEGEGVEFCGVQSKEYYKLCDFFTKHNLWAGADDIKKKSSGKGKTFVKVFNHISSRFGGVSKDPALKPLIDARQRALLKAHIGFSEFSEEQIDALRLAYGLVAEVGVENLKRLHPFQAGQIAFKLFHKPKKFSFKALFLKITWSFFKPILILCSILFILNIFFS